MKLVFPVVFGIWCFLVLFVCVCVLLILLFSLFFRVHLHVCVTSEVSLWWDSHVFKPLNPVRHSFSGGSLGGQAGKGIQGFQGCPGLYFLFTGPCYPPLVARGTTSGLAGSVGLAWALSEPPRSRYTISARCMFVPIKTKTSGRGGCLPNWSTSEMITPTDTTAASASARKWMIFPFPWQREASPQTHPLPCRTFMPINGTGWVEEQKGWGWREQA